MTLGFDDRYQVYTAIGYIYKSFLAQDRICTCPSTVNGQVQAKEGLASGEADLESDDMAVPLMLPPAVDRSSRTA